jgi:hypothetical protein
MARDHALIMHAGAHPTWLPKARYHEHPELFRGRIRDAHLRFETTA